MIDFHFLTLNLVFIFILFFLLALLVFFSGSLSQYALYLRCTEALYNCVKVEFFFSFIVLLDPFDLKSQVILPFYIFSVISLIISFPLFPLFPLTENPIRCQSPRVILCIASVLPLFLFLFPILFFLQSSRLSQLYLPDLSSEGFVFFF